MFRSAKNIVKNENISMFDEDFEERYDVEQYCWTKNTIERLLKSLEFIENCCCLTTPSLGKGFYNVGRTEVVLDIDTRFSYLPKYRYFDIRNPTEQKETFEILIVDPPFFYLSMEQIFNAVLKFPPIKSPLSTGPILPGSKPLNFFDGKYNLSEILTSSSPKEFAALPYKDIAPTTSGKYS